VPYAFLTSSTSYALLAGLLVVRGLGLGSTMMPSMAAAYHVLSGAQVPRATSALNVVQRVGGSLGTAVLAVVLQHEFASALPRGAGGGGGTLGRLPENVRARVAEPLASAFANTFWWAVGISLVALIPAVVLWRTTGPKDVAAPPAREPASEEEAATAAAL
jgi:hypothetical protein